MPALLAARNGLAQTPAVAATPLADLGGEDRFDVCIIGSGPAGALLASGLVRSGVKTLVVESGPGGGARDARVAELDAYSTSGMTYRLGASRFRGVGGTSNLWTGSCSRLHPGDLSADNPYAPAGSPWPLSYTELEPYYTRAEAELSVRGVDRSSLAPPRSAPYPLALGPHEGIAELEAALAGVELALDRVPLSDFDGQPLRTARTHLPAFSRSRHGTFVQGGTATKFVADRQGRVAGLRVQTLARATKTLRASVYVVAGGVVETCRLLLLSRSPEFPDGIGVRSDLVGRYFMTHYQGPIARAKVSASNAGFQYAVSRRFLADARERGLGAVQLRLILSPRSETQSLMVLADMEIEPSAGNRITLDRTKLDYFGNPGAHLHLAKSERDEQTRRYAQTLVRRVAKQLKLGDAKVFGDLRCASHHHMGGCRMGNDPHTSVVDANLRVHGTENLYVAGGAPFATSGIAHPTLTISALSIRLADHLANEFRNTPG